MRAISQEIPEPSHAKIAYIKFQLNLPEANDFFTQETSPVTLSIPTWSVQVIQPILVSWLLTYWGWDNMATISQTTYQNVSFFNENVLIWIEISPKFVNKGPINNIPA